MSPIAIIDLFQYPCWKNERI